ncbi:hypothetical protein Glove_89g119 [Diversispora epigaea]|uniref:Protein kinase domain-containing protein n=1 Tax=Diversispora epigaea TaxID=1348612 RepID=A0A397JEJ5_9GLOM|nr:hypothetical protein Glove_89g119 [Diversispora epigaea]
MEVDSRPTSGSSSSESSTSSGGFSSHNTSSSKSSIVSDDLELKKRHHLVYGICKECESPKTSARWCKQCNSEKFKSSKKFHSWTSGNEDIDNFILTTQITAIGCSQVLEWIPWERFKNIKRIGLGTFGVSYNVTWLDGYITHWDSNLQSWGRCDARTEFTVKVFRNLSNNIPDFLNELLTHQNGRNGLIRCYGITQHPETKDYAIVIRCIETDLRSFLYKDQPFPEYDWKTKLEIISDIAFTLQRIHDNGSLHKCLHTGNLRRQMNSILITELNSIEDSQNSPTLSGVYGVLPYVAPEVLRGDAFTKAADVYSLGVIMWEIAVQRSPFDNNAHDKLLAQRICCGLRPHMGKIIPKSLSKLIKSCWDAKIENRPEAEEVSLWVQWWLDVCNEPSSDIAEEFHIADNERKFKEGITWIHPEAVYHKRHLDFPSLPDPENFSPETYYKMVSFCARIHHSDGFNCHVELDSKDIFEFVSLLSRRPSIYIEDMEDRTFISTPDNYINDESLSEFKMPGAYINNVNEVIVSWQDIENYIHNFIMTQLPNAISLLFPQLPSFYLTLPSYLRIVILSLIFYAFFTGFWSIGKLLQFFFFRC